METTPTIMETIAETIAATVPPETVAEAVTETIPQVIEVVETIDYSSVLNQMLFSIQNIEVYLQLVAAFSLFAVVVCLCYFCYKFFRIFF